MCSQLLVYTLQMLTLHVLFDSNILLLQNLTKLCCVVCESVSAFCVDFWLQTNLHQAGVLWHLLLYLFNYDYTLEEGGVQKSGETNQQVCLTPFSTFQCMYFFEYVILMNDVCETCS